MNNRGKSLVENKLSRYNDQLYINGPVSVNEYISSKMDDVHSQLYNIALEQYIKEHIDDNIKDYRFVEIKNKDYLVPPKVLKIYKRKPYTKEYIDISPYWKEYIYLELPDFTILKMDKDNNINNSEITDIDYYNGVVHMYNKISNKAFIMPFNRVNSDTPVNESLLNDETFQYKYYNDLSV